MLPTQFATRFIDSPWTTRRWPPVGITIETGGARRAGGAESQQAGALGIVLHGRREADALEVLGHDSHRRCRRSGRCCAEVGTPAAVQHLGDVDDADSVLAHPQRDVVVESERKLGSDAARLVERPAPEDGEAARIRVHREPLGRPVRLEARTGRRAVAVAIERVVELVLVRVDEVDVVVGDGEHALDGDGVDAVTGVEPGDELRGRVRRVGERSGGRHRVTRRSERHAAVEPARRAWRGSGAMSSGLATTQASQRPAVWCRSESTDSATRSSGAPTATTTIEMRGGA